MYFNYFFNVILAWQHCTREKEATISKIAKLEIYDSFKFREVLFTFSQFTFSFKTNRFKNQKVDFKYVNLLIYPKIFTEVLKMDLIKAEIERKKRLLEEAKLIGPGMIWALL